MLVERELSSTERAVAMIAQSPAFDAEFDAPRFATLVNRVIGDEPLWRAISVSDTEGWRLLDVPTPIGGRQGGRVVDLVSLQATVRGKRPVVGDLKAGPSGRYAFAVRAPVVRHGKVTQVVSAVVDPAALRHLLIPRQVPADWRVQILDRSGRIIADAGDPAATGRRALAPQPASDFNAMGLTPLGDAGDQLGLSRRVGETGWTVLVSVPEQAYGGPTRLAVLTLLGGLLVGSALGGTLALLLRRELANERRRSETNLEMQRLEALGRMTGGVAHDFNNLLTPILGGLDLLKKRVPDDVRTQRLLEGAVSGAERARDLVARLLAFARRQELNPQPVDLQQVLGGLTDLIRPLLGDRIALRTDFDGPLVVEVDAGQLELAVINLAVNARDAMPEGGTLILSAKRERQARPPGLPEGDYVCVGVMDTGEGMDARTLERAIEPFYTTKSAGHGTGLGLSIVHGLAAQSGGRLTLTSAVGEGTKAEIWLPISAREATPTTEAEVILAGRVGVVLLVDDDALVRAATAEILRDHGHTVIEAGSAAEAITYLSKQTHADALVTDFAMPGRSGASLAEETRTRWPELPVLLVTGYAPDTLQLPEGVARLNKPFRRAQLLGALEALLSQRSDATARAQAS